MVFEDWGEDQNGFWWELSNQEKVVDCGSGLGTLKRCKDDLREARKLLEFFARDETERAALAAVRAPTILVVTPELEIDALTAVIHDFTGVKSLIERVAPGEQDTTVGRADHVVFYAIPPAVERSTAFHDWCCGWLRLTAPDAQYHTLALRSEWVDAPWHTGRTGGES